MTAIDPLTQLGEIIHIGNDHVVEAELIEAVVARLNGLGMAGHVMVRLLSDDRTTLDVAGGQHVKGSERIFELSKTRVPYVGSFEGLAIEHRRTVHTTSRDFPDIELDPEYLKTCLHLADIGVLSGTIIPLIANDPVGVVTFYGFEDVPFDERSIVLASQAARVLASGIEKCRLIASAAAQRTAMHRTNELLEASNRDLQDFAYVASHDLQEPLRKIQTFGDRLEAKAADRLSDDQRRHLARMGAASKSMQRLIDDLLRFSRVDSRGSMPSPIDAGPIVSSALGRLDRQLADVGADVRVGELPTVLADPEQLEEVFVTLMVNSMKYRQPDTNPVIVIEADRRAIGSDGGRTIIYRDNGLGFDPKYDKRIFQPFFRLHSDAEYEGSGIGLAVCERIMQRVGGSISAHGRPGEGAVFTLAFPTPGSEPSRAVQPSGSAVAPIATSGLPIDD